MSTCITVGLSPSNIEIFLNTVTTRDIVFAQDKFTGTGSQTTFATANKFKANSVLVFINGILVEKGAGKTYVEGGALQSVVFAAAPAGGSAPDEILVYYAIL